MWTELCGLRDKFVKILRVCISLSRALYSSELKALQEERKLKAQGKTAPPLFFDCKHNAFSTAKQSYTLNNVLKKASKNKNPS